MNDRTAAALRARIGWMGQKPHVFAGPVAANVALGRALEAGSVEAAMRFAQLEHVAQAHPGAALGEGGLGLSGGEAVRLALARIAVHPQADLLLVDEPTAHLDTETARRVADALLELARGRTMIDQEVEQPAGNGREQHHQHAEHQCHQRDVAVLAEDAAQCVHGRPPAAAPACRCSRMANTQTMMRATCA